MNDSKEINVDTHIYLYAKYHYQVSGDIIDDLKVIIGERCCIDSEHVTKRNIIDVLVSVVLDQILTHCNAKHRLMDFFDGIDPNNVWKVGGTVEESYDLGVIRKCLSVLRLTKVKHIPNLGDPDPNLLPLSINARRK